jgi:TRAP-type C4-dicarboxylate transport system substrate-binding protein
MVKMLARFAVIAFVLFPLGANAEPVKLKFAFFSSDRALLYRAAVKPFADGVNADGLGTLEIDVQFSGALGKDPAQQVQLVLDGTADLAFVVPGYTPDRFKDNGILELPGMFRDIREATQVYTRLIAANALAGYEDFVVIGAFTSEPQTIHSRQAVASIRDLSGKTIRVNNAVEGTALEKLGMLPVILPINQTSDAMIAGKVDAAAVPPAMLYEFGIGRAASHHFLLRVSVAPLTLLMNRTKFESLPTSSQNIIRKYSGEWAASRFIEVYDAGNSQAEQKLNSDARRKVVVPSQANVETAAEAFKTVTEQWLAKAPRNRELLKTVEMEIAKLRATR